MPPGAIGLDFSRQSSAIAALATGERTAVRRRPERRDERSCASSPLRCATRSEVIEAIATGEVPPL